MNAINPSTKVEIWETHAAKQRKTEKAKEITILALTLIASVAIFLGAIGGSIPLVMTVAIVPYAPLVLIPILLTAGGISYGIATFGVNQAIKHEVKARLYKQDIAQEICGELTNPQKSLGERGLFFKFGATKFERHTAEPIDLNLEENFWDRLVLCHYLPQEIAEEGKRITVQWRELDKQNEQNLKRKKELQREWAKFQITLRRELPFLTLENMDEIQKKTIQASLEEIGSSPKKESENFWNRWAANSNLSEDRIEQALKIVDRAQALKSEMNQSISVSQVGDQVIQERSKKIASDWRSLEEEWQELQNAISTV